MKKIKIQKREATGEEGRNERKEERKEFNIFNIMMNIPSRPSNFITDYGGQQLLRLG